MIYNTASVFLAGLISIASAASVQHAPKSHNALVATEHPTQLVKKINESDYSQECVKAWKIFDASRCWCFTGCALDCSQNGEPGVPGTKTNPDLCQDLPPKEMCLEQTCDLVGKCTDKDASVLVDGAEPGLDKIVETGGYDCKDNDKIVQEDLPAEKWYLGEKDQSCTAVCSGMGKKCNQDMLNKVLSISTMQAVAAQIDSLGDNCPNSWSWDPCGDSSCAKWVNFSPLAEIHRDDEYLSDHYCYFNEVSPGSQSTCDGAPDGVTYGQEKGMYQRFCPCE